MKKKSSNLTPPRNSSEREMRLTDYASSLDEQAAVSHWVHLARTPFSKPYAVTAERCLPLEIRESLDESCVRDDCAGQLLFPDLFDVPFTSPNKHSFTFIDLSPE